MHLSEQASGLDRTRSRMQTLSLLLWPERGWDGSTPNPGHLEVKAPASGPLEVPAQPEKLVWTCLVVLVYRQAGSHPPGQILPESLHIPNVPGGP